MELKDRLLTYIEKHFPISDEVLMRVANSKGFTQAEVYSALEAVGRDRRISTKTRKDAIWYDIYIEPEAKPTPTHVEWCRDNYPWPGKNGIPEFVLPFPEIDLNHIFLKTKEERDAYKAAASGRPIHMLKKHYVNARG